MLSSYQAEYVAVHNGYGELAHIECSPTWAAATKAYENERDRLTEKAGTSWPVMPVHRIDEYFDEYSDGEESLVIRYGLDEWRHALAEERVEEWHTGDAPVDLAVHETLYDRAYDTVEILCTECGKEIS